MSQQLKFYKGNETNLQNVSDPEVGAIYHCQDTGNTYLVDENGQFCLYSNAFTYSDDEENISNDLINADTLNGMRASDFVTPGEVDEKIDEAVEGVAYVSNVDAGSEIILADAESLGGIPAEQYPTQKYMEDYVASAINNAQIGGGSGGDIDLSIYATQGYVDTKISQIDYPVDSVNGKTGTVSLSADDVGARHNTWTPASTDLLNAYPVGSIYLSVNSTSPASLFGGTWTQLKDRFLLGCGDTYSNNKTGGAAEVTLTTNQMPKHRHTTAQEWVSENGVNFAAYTIQSDHLSTTEAESNYYPNYTEYAGSGAAHNNMPPYLTVYMWKRTA